MQALGGLTKLLQKKDSDGDFVSLEGTLIVRKKGLLSNVPTGTGLVHNASDLLLNKGVTLQLVSSDRLDGGSSIGKFSKECDVENWLSVTGGESTYKVTLKVPRDFGTPGALLVRNTYSFEFFLVSFNVVLPNRRSVYFPCYSWVYHVKKYKGERIFFSNQVYLPDKTPEGLLQLRESELVTMRGDGRGERHEWDRIYDYDLYNDLGDPNKPEMKRPGLGGQDLPFPRRCRTNRKRHDKDPSAETSAKGSSGCYVPRDEQYDAQKQSDFLFDNVVALGHNLLPSLRNLLLGSNEFKCFKDVLSLYLEGIDYDSKLRALQASSANGEIDPLQVLADLGVDRQKSSLKFPKPQILLTGDEAWRDDEEFARQRLAGINPLQIERLEVFPVKSTLSESKHGDPMSAITANHILPYLEGLSVEQAIDAKRLYILDYYDLFLPLVYQINHQEKSPDQIYATRTLFFLNGEGTLKPVAIELALPNRTGQVASKRVFTPPMQNNRGSGRRDLKVLQEDRDWKWELAKAHVRSNDSTHHQLYSHWARTHAAVEPYIIATNRQLSVMHPIHLLLKPHFKNTMNTNSKAREVLICANGIIETCFSPGKYSLEFSARCYDAQWQFDKEALPADLLKRKMAEPDAGSESGVKLVLEDYPYAQDGLDLWCAIRSWIHAYVDIFYEDDKTIQQDKELREWWTDIRTKGHYDKKDAPGWPTLDSKADLIKNLTIIIWVASALHAAVNFGQYAYSGYLPNLPSSMRKLIPADESSKDLIELDQNPERYFIQAHASKSQATTVMVITEILSSHAKEEQYLGERDDSQWTNDGQVIVAFQKFGERLDKLMVKFTARNESMQRWGPAQVPYTLLYPFSQPGVTGRGVPNSISI